MNEQWVCTITDEVMDDFGNIVEQDEQCIKCDMSYGIDNIIYAKQDGTLSSSEGDPYCEGCLPEQPNY